MKFIVFNVVVAVALVYLVANKDSGFEASLPNLDDVTAAAQRSVDRVFPAEKEAPALVDAPTIAEADLATSLAVPKSKPEAEAAPPPPPAPPLPAVPVIEVPVREAHVVTVPPPDGSISDPVVGSEVAQRRAEVLGEGPAATLEAVQPTADRRRQLLDLAEEMEYLSAEFAAQ